MRENRIFVLFFAVILFLAIVATVFFQCFFGIMIVSGESMEPTLKSGQFVVFSRNTKNLKKGDVIIFKSEKEESVLVKRIVASEGDTIQIYDGYVYICGEKSTEKYNSYTEYPGIALTPILLNQGEFFVLGDNRLNSKDSRFSDIGIIKEKDIIGIIPGR